MPSSPATPGPPPARTPPDSSQAWAGIADVAAITGVLADLDADLVRAAARLPGREALADDLSRAATSGLALAARETAALAAAGPLPPRGLQPPAPTNRVVVRVADPHTAVAAQQQLAALLRTAGHIRPERLQLITIGHLRACTALIAALDTGTTTEGRQLVGDLRHHARLLLQAADRRPVAASLYGSDPLPVRQAAELYQALKRPGDLILRIVADAELVQGFAAALADTTRALAETADRHLAAGVWLIQVQVDDGLAWQPPDSLHDVPQPFQALRAAAVHAEHLTRLLPAADQAVPAPAPRRALAPAPFTALRTPHRPATPDIPAFPINSRGTSPPRRPLRR
jgi:hypothetical protein